METRTSYSSISQHVAISNSRHQKVSSFDSKFNRQIKLIKKIGLEWLIRYEKYYLGIDDLRITRGSCPNQGDCSFEDETLCEYENMADSDFNWITNSGAGPNLFTGCLLISSINNQLVWK